MRTKTAYRENKSEGGNKPAVEAATAPSPEATEAGIQEQSEKLLDAIETPATRKYAEEATKADEAAAALRRQIEALRHSEALLRQPPQPQRPLTREEKLAAWKTQGMPQVEVDFLERNPDLVDADRLTAFSANEALQQGHSRGSPEFFDAVKANFDRHLIELQNQAQQTEQPMQETPKFFQPPPPPKPRTPPSIVSAPVSREIPTGGPRPEYQQDPTKVHLSVAEREIARASGISEIEYARQKVRLEREKRDGLRQ
jgi:hypothetical protein